MAARRSMTTPTHDPNCLFCKIVAGDIPARKLYEDDQVVAFHDISPAAPAPRSGWTLFVLALLLYALGRSQDILLFEVGSLVPMLAAVMLILRGGAALRLLLFPLFFMLFMVPLPAPVSTWGCCRACTRTCR